MNSTKNRLRFYNIWCWWKIASTIFIAKKDTNGKHSAKLKSTKPTEKRVDQKYHFRQWIWVFRFESIGTANSRLLHSSLCIQWAWDERKAQWAHSPVYSERHKDLWLFGWVHNQDTSLVQLTAAEDTWIPDSRWSLWIPANGLHLLISLHTVAIVSIYLAIYVNISLDFFHPINLYG